MKIAILGTRGVPANYGGFETFAAELSTRLVKRGHEVFVYCREDRLAVGGWRLAGDRGDESTSRRVDEGEPRNAQLSNSQLDAEPLDDSQLDDSQLDDSTTRRLADSTGRLDDSPQAPTANRQPPTANWQGVNR
ncbi:MAG: DUF1972 domain-containing protein, partial [Acidobacteriota bacterium]